MSKTTLAVSGMRCAGCVSSVEKRLQAATGVQTVSVNLATERADIVHNPETSTDTLIAAVEAAGFHAQPLNDHEDDSSASAADESADPHAHHTQAAVGRRDWLLWWGFAALGALVMVIAMTGPARPSAGRLFLQLLLTAPIQYFLGRPFYEGAWRRLKHGGADMDTLVALGTTVAFGYSLIVTLLAPFAISGGWWIDQPVVYYETAAMILVLISLGKLLEARARSSAMQAITGLVELQPRTATVIRDDQQTEIPVREVQPGDVILVRPGQRVPVDGRIIEGRSEIDQSVVTGESLPIEVGPGDRAIGGTFNQAGAFRMNAEQTGSHTVLAQIIELVRHAQASKADIQRLADRVAGVFVPVVLVVALVTFTAWLIAGGDGRLTSAISATVAVLIVACPCALGLAVPMAVMVGTGIGARHGILIKEPAALERAGKLTHIILDKTGTLTIGRPRVSDIIVLEDGRDSHTLIHFAAAVEAMSEHPLARAIVAHHRRTGKPLADVTDFQSLTAIGVKGDVDGHTIIVAKPQALAELDVEHHNKLDKAIAQLDPAAQSIVAVAIDGRVAGLIALVDTINPQAPWAVARLRDLGLKVILMTGDNARAASIVADQLDIPQDDVKAEVLPAHKHDQVRAIQAQGGVVAMVGDGVNDAPALAAADLGIAIGAAAETRNPTDEAGTETPNSGQAFGGTDIAARAGHIVLMGGDLENLPHAITLSRAMMRRIRLGLFWAFAYNVVLIPVAAFGWLHPMFAAAAMSISSVSVVVNALYLRRSWTRHRPAATG